MDAVCRSCGRKLPMHSAHCSECGTEPVAFTGMTFPRGPGSPNRPATPTTGPGSEPFADTLTDRPSASAPKPLTGPLEPGQEFGHRYRIRRLLGIGGMGAVYQAWDAELAEDVAIKLIRPDVMSNPGFSAEIQSRFKRELVLARRVSHRNVVRIHDIGEIDGLKYITMTYLAGTDLATLLSQQGRLPVRRAVRLTRQICAGLAAAHAAGVIHRDLKPANIMVGENDQAVITDFGIARLEGDRHAPSAAGAIPLVHAIAPGGTDLGLTQAGSMVGTVQYMAPEQARGDHVDQRADVYALGLMLHDMLGARRRSSSPSGWSEFEERRARPLPPLHPDFPEVSTALDAIIARCTAPDPAKRFQTSAELGAALDLLDDEGNPRPAPRTAASTSRRTLLVAGAVLVAIAGLAYALRPRTRPPHAPVSVIISDFANRTGDSTFDRTLEPVVKLSLESAPFITAYSRTDLKRALSVNPPEVLDEKVASELAVKQGLGLVVSGTIEQKDSGYRVSETARQPITGQVVAQAERSADARGDVLATVGAVSEQLRKRLGDDTSDSEQRFAMDTLTATSLDVVHDYALAMDALASSKFEQARASFERAVQRDPNFGLAYAGLAIASSNLGKTQEAQRWIGEAVRHVDRMTPRERLRVRGTYYLLTADYPHCVSEYTTLTTKYRSDAAAVNNLALCLTKLRDLPRALEEEVRAIGILPNRALYRVNVALYAAYASDFATAQREALRAKELTPIGNIPLAFAQLGSGQLEEARQTYTAFAAAGGMGRSLSGSGLADLAIYQGRYSEAVQMLEKAAEVDRAGGDPDRAAAKLVALAQAELLRGRRSAAEAAARRAINESKTTKVRFLAGRIYALSGSLQPARALASALAGELPAEPRAHSKILEGMVALSGGDTRQAITLIGEANTLLDTWIGRFELARAYFEAGAYAQADSELDRCITRRGEALSLFLDEEPTFGIYPMVEYYQGRVREGLKTAGFADSYRRYLSIRGAAGEDALLGEVRRRAVSDPGDRLRPSPSGR